MKKKVSIIVPCYNGEKYVGAFMDSVAAQEHTAIELIFIDDGSTDLTHDIVLSYKQELTEKGIDLKYIYQENQGQAAAMNCGLKIFSGDYLMWVDSDDILLPNNVREKYEFLEQNPECDFVLCEGFVVRAEDLSTVIGELKRTPPVSAEDPLFKDLLFEHNVVYGPGTILARREAIMESIPTLHIYESRQGQNWQMMLPLAYKGRCGYITKKLFKYVLHEDSHSHQKREYKDFVQRQDEFCSLIINTLKMIPGMTEKELSDWQRLIETKYTRNKLKLAYVYNSFSDARKACKELRRLNALKITDLYFGFQFCRIVRKIGRIFLRK